MLRRKSEQQNNKGELVSIPDAEEECNASPWVRGDAYNDRSDCRKYSQDKKGGVEDNQKIHTRRRIILLFLRASRKINGVSLGR